MRYVRCCSLPLTTPGSSEFHVTPMARRITGHAGGSHVRRMSAALGRNR